MTLPDRFWAKVDRRGPDECWRWTAANNGNGYGVLTMPRDGQWHLAYAHRLAYADAHGPIPQGLVIDHLCDVKCCVNPAHLEAVQQWVNRVRCTTQQTSCMAGHPLDGANLYINPRGQRQCRTCRNEAQRRYNARRRAALQKAAA